MTLKEARALAVSARTHAMHFLREDMREQSICDYVNRKLDRTVLTTLDATEVRNSRELAKLIYSAANQE